MTTDADTVEGRLRAATHVFQIVRPVHPQMTAICARCGLCLPRGPIMTFLPPCGEPPVIQDNG